MLPSLKLNELRNKLKLSNNTDISDRSKGEKKAKSPLTRSRKGSGSSSPTKKAVNRGLEKTKDIIKGSDIRAKLDNILKGKGRANKSTKHEQDRSDIKTDRSETVVTSVDTITSETNTSQPITDSVTNTVVPSINKEATCSSTSSATVNTWREEAGSERGKFTQAGSELSSPVLKFSKREKRRPVKYSPEITKAPIPRHRDKSVDKKSGKPKSQRKVDFGESPSRAPAESRSPVKGGKTTGQKQTKDTTPSKDSKLAKTPTEKSDSKLAKTPTEKSVSKLAKTPTEKSVSKLAKTPTEKSDSKLTKTTTEKSDSKLAKAPAAEKSHIPVKKSTRRSRKSKSPGVSAGCQTSEDPLTPSTVPPPTTDDTKKVRTYL